MLRSLHKLTILNINWQFNVIEYFFGRTTRVSAIDGNRKFKQTQKNCRCIFYDFLEFLHETQEYGLKKLKKTFKELKNFKF